MREITFLIAILIAANANAQPHFSMGIGYGHAAIVQINAGYSFGSLMLEYDQRTPTNRSTPGIMGIRAGYAVAYSVRFTNSPAPFAAHRCVVAVASIGSSSNVVSSDFIICLL